MLIYLLEGLAWLVNDLLNVTSGIWIGFFVVTAGLLISARSARHLRCGSSKRAPPPTPQLAIEEAKKKREVLAGRCTADAGAARPRRSARRSRQLVPSSSSPSRPSRQEFAS